MLYLLVAMYGYIERLQKLGYVMDNELYIYLILHSLPSTFSHYVLNFNMHKLEVTVPELCHMLKTAQENLPETPKPIIVVAASKHKRKQKGKGKKGFLKPTKGIQKKTAPKKAKEPKGTCFHCDKEGHWKRSCKKYLESLKGKKKEHTDASALDIYTIEICSFSISSKSLWYCISDMDIICEMICRH